MLQQLNHPQEQSFMKDDRVQLAAIFDALTDEQKRHIVLEILLSHIGQNQPRNAFNVLRRESIEYFYNVSAGQFGKYPG